MKLSIETQAALRACGFVKRGNAFFRLHGDGVLQVVKSESTRPFCESEIYIGLFSMYGALHPQWFTSRGCIPRYPVQNVVGKEKLTLRLSMRRVCTQEEILCTDGIPWLTTIDTQEKLLGGIVFLETSFGSDIQWVDQIKIAPALACGNYSFAKHVIEETLSQHKGAYSSNRHWMTKEAFEKYIKSRIDEDLGLEHLLQMIEEEDHSGIQNFLATNCAQNQSCATFILEQRNKKTPK